MNYRQSLDFLDSFRNYEQTVQYRYPEAFSLDRVVKLLDRLGNPHRKYPALHVAGTKGKGSTCAFSAALLRAAGLRTALYTSPHLLDFRERFRIDGALISEQELAEIVDEIRPFAAQDLTYFEVTTACAFLWFARRGVDAAVIEVGLGGRLDATNVVEPEVMVLTPIGLDHASKLGNTLGEIAREKAGILKRGVPAVVAPQLPEAAEQIRRAAGESGAPLHWVEEEVDFEELSASLQGTEVSLRTPGGAYRAVRIPLLGRHQAANAAAALLAAELFSRRRPAFSLSEEAVRKGFLGVEWPGRCQWVPGDPDLFLDGAQTRESAQALRATAEELFPGRSVTLVIGVSTDKDVRGIAQVLGPWAGRVLVTQAAGPRAEPAEAVKWFFAPFAARLETVPSVEAALRRAREEASSGDLVVVCGSLFIVAEAMRLLSVDGAGGPGTGSPRSVRKAGG